MHFEDYKEQIPNAVSTEAHKDITTETPKLEEKEVPKHIKTETPKKAKRTFYIQESVLAQLDTYYAKCLMNNKKVDKGDIVTQAIKNLLEDENAEVGIF